MERLKNKRFSLSDRKNPLVYAFWSTVNKLLIKFRFQRFEVIGKQNIPVTGPFLLVSNHCSRWDGLIVYHTIGRPSNFMVSPNELKGNQGAVLVSMGAFPANPRFDLIGHALSMFNKGQGVVVFPEGNTFYDGNTHNFKTGAAKIAFAAAQSGYDIPILPAAIHYSEDGKVARIAIGEPINATESCDNGAVSPKSLRTFSDRLHREVCFLRSGLGSLGDKLAVLSSTGNRDWSALISSQSTAQNFTA